MQISVDDPGAGDITALLRAHVAEMRSVSPPESCHVLESSRLRDPGITFWTARADGVLAGCAALWEIDAAHGEIKSMRTARGFRECGVASLLLEHLVAEARTRGYRRLSLETGSQPFFEPARNLYVKHGFRPCAAFSGYVDDPNSIFLTRELAFEQ